jgi:hypothetical protein
MLRLRRLLDMSLPEVAVRARQQAGKHAERFWPPAPRRIAGPGRVVDEARAAARRLPPGGTLAGVPDLLRRRHPCHVEQLVVRAEGLLRGEFDLLGYRALRFGSPIDWHLDPVARRRAPRVHWSRIDPLDANVVGDSKVVWELNRHQWMVTLAQAFMASGDERYAAACEGLLPDWRRENPRGVGINWASSLEVALRLISWCWTIALLEAASGLRPQLAEEAALGIAEHAAHVARYLSRYFSPNTHLTGEALGLVYAGSVLTHCPEAEAWREQGTAILVDEAARQVLADGVYFEQATCYQRYTAEILLHLHWLAGAAGRPLPESVTDATQRVLDFLLAVRHGDGSLPSIGDADGGWLLPLERRAPDDLRGVFGLAAALFSRPDYAWASGATPPEVAWMLGREGTAAYEALQPRPPERDPSRLFEAGGYAVMSDGWGSSAHRLILDVGPLGCPISAGHGHADLLAIECSVFGQRCVVDPGTYAYTKDAAWRDHFRSARAHSVPTADGREPALPAGAFAWRSRPAAQLRQWLSTPRFDYADAEHAAFAAAGAPLRLRRRVLFAKPRFFLVLDELSGKGEHALEMGFQFAPLPLRVAAGEWLLAELGSGRGLALRCFGSLAVERSVHEGEVDPIGGWVSPDYGLLVKAPLLRLVVRGRLPLRVLTVLVPMADVAAPPPRVEPLSRDGREASGLRFATGEEFVFGEHEVVFECAESSASSL